MKNKTLITLVFSIFLTSCIEQKYILKGNTISTIKTTPENNGLATDSLFIFKVKSAFKSKIETRGDYMVINNVNKKNLSLVSSVKLEGPPTGTKKDFIGKYYYPEVETPTTLRKLIYLDTKPVLQGITIPLKIRPKLNETALLDSFPSQAETGFNIALAGGWKFNINSYSSKKDLFGKNLRQFSFTPGWLVGTGAVDLKKTNTRDPVIKFEHKAAIISTGGFFMLGYNNINIGYSFGWDFVIGEGHKGWLYNGKLWHGITIGLDIIK